MENDVEIVIRTKNLFPQESTRSGFLQCLFDSSLAKRKFTADINESEMTIHGECRNHTSFDQLVRIAFHDHAILASARLAFVGVAAQIDWFSRILRNESPFHSCGKTGAATTA